jgi:hypothetical protein
MGDPMKELGDKGLILDAVAFGFHLNGLEVLAVDPDIQDGILAPPSHSLGNRLKLRLSHVNILSPQQGVLDLLFASA